MIRVPQRVVRGQILTADLINRLIDTLTVLRPIAGKGILIQETPKGVIITQDATEKHLRHDTAPAAWQVRQGVADDNGTATWELFSPLCSAPTGEFLPTGMTAENWNPLPAENASGTLYATIDLSGDTPICTLENNLTLPLEGKVSIRIGTFTTNTGTNKTTFTQNHLGVLHLGGNASEDAPAAWTVRQKDTAWEIFAPLWITGKTERLPASMSLDWNALSVTSGTLYALCTFEGTFDPDTEETSWTFKELTLSNAIPDDIEADRYSSGLKTLAVRIGTFSTDTATNTTTFQQIHVGVIVEDWNKGEKGEKGAPGTPGKDGTDGSDGDPGKDGISWSATVLDNTGTYGDGTYKITFTASDGSATITTPNLIGPQGEPGKDGEDGTDGEDGSSADLGTPHSLSVVTDVIYDSTTHKFYLKKRTISFYGTLGTESSQDITTAIPHSSQHQ